MVIYWSHLDYNDEASVLNIKPPTPLIHQLPILHSSLDKKCNNSYLNSFHKCPSIIDFCKNKFLLKSPFDFSLAWEKYETEPPTIKIKLKNEMLDDNFILKNFSVKDASNGFMSFLSMSYVFFSEDDIEMELLPAYLNRNHFANYTTILPGKLNIGKWFRNLDFPFFINVQNTWLDVNNDDNICCVSFNTDQKIQLKRFFCTDKHKQLLRSCSHHKLLNQTPLKNYFNELYKKFNQSKIKKLIIKEIKDNLME